MRTLPVVTAFTVPKVAVVTGGTSGIGLACVRRLLAAGCRVAAFSQQPERVKETARLLQAEFGDASSLVAAVDLRDPEAIGQFFKMVEQRWRPPDILVCNAGFSPKRSGKRPPFDETTLAEWNDVLSVNLTGAMLCCQAVANHMASNAFGRIIFIGSVAARTLPRIAGASYVTSKAALAGLARALVAEFNGTGVTVNTVAPGRILTEMTGPATSEANQSALQRIPVGRLGTPDDIAATVLFLASDDAGFLNGAMIDVNGGEFSPA